MKFSSDFLLAISAFMTMLGIVLTSYFSKVSKKKRDKKTVDKVLNEYKKIDAVVDNRSDVDILRKL